MTRRSTSGVSIPEIAHRADQPCAARSAAGTSERRGDQPSVLPRQAMRTTDATVQAAPSALAAHASAGIEEVSVGVCPAAGSTAPAAARRNTQSGLVSP